MEGREEKILKTQSTGRTWGGTGSLEWGEGSGVKSPKGQETVLNTGWETSWERERRKQRGSTPVFPVSTHPSVW